MILDDEETPSQRWEYKVLSSLEMPSRLETQLNAFGESGWELISAESCRFIFKRPKSPEISVSNDFDDLRLEADFGDNDLRLNIELGEDDILDHD